MPTDELDPNQVLILEFETRRRNPRVVFDVSSNIPVTTYLVDDMGMEDFEDGRIPDYYAGFRNRRRHQADIFVSDFDKYYLLIQNKSQRDPAKIKYDLRVR